MKLKTYVLKQDAPDGWLARIGILTSDIRASNSVLNFQGVSKYQTSLFIMGEAILNESALNALMISHFDLLVPQSVTPRQIRLALLRIGLTEAMIDGAIATLPSPNKEVASITWKVSTEFHRDNPMVPLLAQMLNKSPAELDQLWILASSL